MRTPNAAATVALALILGAGPASASGSAGAEPFSFLRLDANARAVAMGGAYTALATDANALLYNPAGLARVARSEATFMHNAYVAGIDQEYGAYASPRGWGAHFNFLNSGSVMNTTNTNPDGAGLGSTSLYDLAFSGGYGRAFGEALSLGGEVKYIRESIAGVAGQGAAFDLGALYRVPRISGLALGVSLLNVGPTVKYDSGTQNLPLNLRAGAAYTFDAAGQKSAASFDVIKERASSADVALGLETVLVKAMPIRLGFTTSNSAGLGLTAGVGYVSDGFSFDYAFVPFGDLGGAHRFSLTFRWRSDADRASPRTARRRAAQKMAPDPAVEEKLRVVREKAGSGMLALNENDYAAAKGFFSQAVLLADSCAERNSYVADAYAGMGMCLVEEGQTDEAMKFFDKALEAGPRPEAMLLIQRGLETLHDRSLSPRPAEFEKRAE